MCKATFYLFPFFAILADLTFSVIKAYVFMVLVFELSFSCDQDHLEYRLYVIKEPALTLFLDKQVYFHNRLVNFWNILWYLKERSTQNQM